MKFTERGRVDIEVDATPSRTVGDKQYIDLEIAVCDTGIGIAAEDREKIFQIFAQSEGQNTRRFGGTGLGLAIVDRLAQLLGGSIALASEVGQGSTFTCRFPNLEIAAEPVFSAAHRLPNLGDAAAVSPKLTVLIADDVRSNRDLMAGYLSDRGHELIFAGNGRQAIRIAEAFIPDLILLDLRMPVLDGNQVAAQLRAIEATRDIPIVLVTASLHYERSNEAHIGLYDGILHKPVKKEQLIAMVQAVIQTGQSSYSRP